MSEFTEALKFIQKIEATHPGQSAYEVANRLRGYTRKGYTTELWSKATGYDQPYVTGEFEGKLNGDLILSQQTTDFGHFIAALSDQINAPGLQRSDLTFWTADHTSWAGDIASAFTAYEVQSMKPPIKTLAEALDRFARDSDYAADIAAYSVGLLINSRATASLSQAIAQYDTTLYSRHVRTFVKTCLGGRIEGELLKNPADVEAAIRRPVSLFLRLSSARDRLRALKNLMMDTAPAGAPNVRSRPSREDLIQGSLHFMRYLARHGHLKPLRFKPYHTSRAPSLGTVSYEVQI